MSYIAGFTAGLAATTAFTLGERYLVGQVLENSQLRVFGKVIFKNSIAIGTALYVANAISRTSSFWTGVSDGAEHASFASMYKLGVDLTTAFTALQTRGDQLMRSHAFKFVFSRAQAVCATGAFLVKFIPKVTEDRTAFLYNEVAKAAVCAVFGSWTVLISEEVAKKTFIGEQLAM